MRSRGLLLLTPASRSLLLIRSQGKVFYLAPPLHFPASHQSAHHVLSRRIGTREELEREVQAWQDCRNEVAPTVNRRFRTADARIKRLYPLLEPQASSSQPERVANLV